MKTALDGNYKCKKNVLITFFSHLIRLMKQVAVAYLAARMKKKQTKLLKKNQSRKMHTVRISMEMRLRRMVSTAASH